MSTAATPVKKEPEDDSRQSKLWDFGMEFSRIPVWWDFKDQNQGSSWNVYFTGGPLDQDFLETPQYETVEFLVTTSEPEYPGAGARDFRSRQNIESFFLEKGDRANVNEVARALADPSQTDLWSEIDDGKVPLKAEFEYGGTSFRVEKSRSRDREEGLFYPVQDYLARAERPGMGRQVSTRPLRSNLRREDREALETLVEELKDAGATVYLTGSVLDTPEYEDIDIAIDGLHRPRETMYHRTGEGPYPQTGEEYGGLPRHLSFDEEELEWTLDGISGLEAGEPDEPPEGSGNTVSHGYNAVGLLYSFSFMGTEFDIGYDEEPFHDPSGRVDPLGTGPETRFVKL